jgi:hypothetical protein
MLGIKAVATMEMRKGTAAAHILSQETPTFAPQAVQVAGIAGPKKARRSAEMPGCLQCGHS